MPAFRVVPWAHRPEHDPRWYQAKAVDLFEANRHAAVELATGLGKSYIIALLLKRIGLGATVVAPTLNIAEQLLDDLTNLFGSRLVGQYFDGKKQAAKQFVVAVSASLLRVQAGSADAKAFAAKPVLIGDESHLLPAESLSQVILGLLGSAPYRFFLSGTQIRGDGLETVLAGIVGDILLRMDVRQGVDQGFLTKPRFFQWVVDSDRQLLIDDPVKMNRVHLHANPKVYAHASTIIRHALSNGRRALVLVEEMDQFRMLQQQLPGIQMGFAHGGVTKDNKKLVPEAHHKSDPRKLVKAFDAGELPVLVGTSCIGTGTDIKSASFIVDLVGGKSEVRVRQNVGRGTRLFANKKSCIYNDYSLSNVPVLRKQAETRAKIFEAIYGPVNYQRVR